MNALSDLAFDQVVKSFNSAPFHPEELLNREVAERFFASLSTDISESVLAVFIDDDGYFSRLCQSRGIAIKEHCYSYKHLFFEQFIQEVVSSSSNDSELLLQRINCMADYIHSLRIDSIKPGFPLDSLVVHLPNLSKLQLSFIKSGDHFQRLGRAIWSSPFLTSLVLQDTYITDDDIPVIFNSEQWNITHLDLSHNRISSVGVEYLVDKFITSTSVLSHLDLRGNKICQVGATKIGAALMGNESLVSLNLGLNSLGDTGGANLFKCISQNQDQNTSLKHINVFANKLGNETAKVIAELVAPKETSIESIVLTSNLFSKDDLAMLGQHRICLVGPISEALPSENDIRCLASEMPS